jgi:hypothetical protein
MASMGRPRKTFNWEEFDKLVSMQCPQEEIAAWFNVSVDTLDRNCQRDRGETLAEVWNKRKFLGRVRLRQGQFAIMEKGGPGAATMAIFLDKKMLPHEQPPKEQPPKELPPGSSDNTSRQTGLQSSIPVKRTFDEFIEACRYPKPFPKQHEMKDFVLADGSPRLLLGARGYGKSDYGTVMGIAYAIYCDWFNHVHNGSALSETNVIVSKTKTRNTAMVAEIAAALKANGVPLEKENSAILKVRGLIGKDHSLEALSIRSSFRGRHPKRIIMDDPVTEEDTSEAMRTLVKKKYDEAYKLCKNIVIIGQPAHAFDLYAELRNVIRKLEVPHGTIPELDADLIAMKAAGVDPHSIEMSYHLRIPKDGTSIFSNLKFVDVFPQGNSTIAFIDPSEGGDYTALTVLRGYMDGFAVEGYAWKKAWYHCTDDFVKIVKNRRVTQLCFETNCTGRNPVFQLQQVLSPLGCGVVGKNSDSNKHAVIQSAGSFSHMIYLSRESDPVYTEHVVKYEKNAKYDDAPDSLARCLEWLGVLEGKRRG